VPTLPIGTAVAAAAATGADEAEAADAVGLADGVGAVLDAERELERDLDGLEVPSVCFSWRVSTATKLVYSVMTRYLSARSVTFLIVASSAWADLMLG
jgi:hypothetical protein